MFYNKKVKQMMETTMQHGSLQALCTNLWITTLHGLSIVYSQWVTHATEKMWSSFSAV